jgi:hypothetical protein
MKNIIFITALLIGTAAFSQEDLQIEKTNQKKLNGFIRGVIVPNPVTLVFIQIEGGLEFNHNNWQHTVLAKASTSIFYGGYSLYLQSERVFGSKVYENGNNQNFSIPFWLGSRNLFPMMTEGEEGQYGRSWYQIGSGLNYEFNLKNKLSIYGEIGCGYGPKYDEAGDFGFKDYDFVGFRALPMIDLGVKYSF